MKAVILAAGEGVRMHPLTYTRPKPMLPLANKPILEHLLVEFMRAGITQFVFVVGFGSQKVQEYFADGRKWEVNIAYVVQRKQLGTAHALEVAREGMNGSCIMANGDVLVRAGDITRLLSRDGIVLSVVETKLTRDRGVLEVMDGRVVQIHEKVEAPSSDLVNAGLYRLTPEIFDAISQTRKSVRGEYEITSSLQLLIDRGYPIAYQRLDYWLDLTYPWDLLTANQALLSGLETENAGTIEENVAIKGPVDVGKGTVIRSGSYIVGPTIIGQDCDIGPNSYIRPSTSIGDGCHIGAAVEVKNSIIMRGSKLPHLSYVGDSIIGEGCNLGAGTKIANLRLDKEEIKVAGVATGRKKLGAIIGDGVQTGINASINVGSLIGNGTYIGVGATVGGVILPNSRFY